MNTESNAKIKLNKGSSVVEYNAARQILWRLNLSVRRKDDHLTVTRRGDDGFFYSSDDADKLYSLYIDEGFFSDCMIAGGALLQYCSPWMEMVDYRALLSIIYNELYPDGEHPISGAMGRGRSQCELIDGYHELLKNSENIEFVTIEKKVDYSE